MKSQSRNGQKTSSPSAALAAVVIPMLSRQIAFRYDLTWLGIFVNSVAAAPSNVAQNCGPSNVCAGTDVFNLLCVIVQWERHPYQWRSDDRSEVGSQFRVVGLLTAKLHWLTVVRVRGTSNTSYQADHKCWQPWYNTSTSILPFWS